MEKQCPLCYYNLPDVETTLAPYDTELNYYMWTPGFEWRPEPKTKETSFDDGSFEETIESEESLIDIGELYGKVDPGDAKDFFNQKAKNNKISVQDATICARKLGLAPSNNDEQKISELYGDNLTFDNYLEFLVMSVHDKDTVDKLTKMFEQFDYNGSGLLSKKQMKNILTTWGDVLTDKEANDALNTFSNEDRIDYRQFCQYILE
ncbi:myosin A tail domain interacting protein [Hepatocystis sp. ex Piliocolobus tephrosceles]|nr:myosin A tail domain interacting protein [Hepatocystis sp. ex Piliocolobus tephrosceles]